MRRDLMTVFWWILIAKNLFWLIYGRNSLELDYDVDEWIQLDSLKLSVDSWAISMQPTFSSEVSCEDKTNPMWKLANLYSLRMTAETGE